MKTGIIGATGYAGQQLVSLLANHPAVTIDFLVSNSYVNQEYSDVYKNFRNRINKKFISIDKVDEYLPSTDIIFVAIPHGKSMHIIPKFLKAGIKVVDFGADYRLKSQSTYEKWYNLEHASPHFLEAAVYGLPELHKADISSAQLIANPGCYPTASILSIAPLAKDKLIDPTSIIIDAKSGVSGAGRSLNTATLYGEANETLKAYSLITHRHTPEIAQELSNLYQDDVSVLFAPHLVPMNRGILTTCYAKLNQPYTEAKLFEMYENFYSTHPFIRISKELPETRWVRNTNFCDISLRVDTSTNRVIVVSAIDNLMKGAASQAVHNMNIMCGFDETLGLSQISFLP